MLAKASRSDSVMSVRPRLAETCGSRSSSLGPPEAGGSTPSRRHGTHRSWAEVHNLVTTDVAPGLLEQGRNRSTSSVDRFISAAAQRRRPVERCPLTTRHQANKREHSDEAFQLMSRRDAHPAAEARCVQATTQRSCGPGQPSPQDATRTIVDHRKLSRAEPDVRCRPPLAVQAFLGSNSSKVEGREMRGPGDAHKRTRQWHGGNHDHAKKTAAGSSGRSPMPRTAAMEEKHTNASTQDFFAVMKSLFCAVEELPSTCSTRTSNKTLCSYEEPPLRSEEEYPPAAQAAQYVDDSDRHDMKNLEATGTEDRYRGRSSFPW